LGRHLHDELGVPVIGVAKTVFHGATHAIPVLRGAATRPLYVTSVGIDRLEAADLVGAMAGIHRIPDALRRVDALARAGAAVGSCGCPGSGLAPEQVHRVIDH
jgi:deoxyribonuclease V